MYGIAYFGMGLMYQAKGMSEIAIDNYKMAIKEDIHPDVKITDKAWINIGTIHMKKKAYKDAVDAYTKAVAADTQNGQAHYNLGLAFVKTGDLEQAAKESEEAKKLGIKLVGLDEEIAEKKASDSKGEDGQSQSATSKKTSVKKKTKSR
jgi:tetratricopeptide (TPR) repeat protein